MKDAARRFLTPAIFPLSIIVAMIATAGLIATHRTAPFLDQLTLLSPISFSHYPRFEDEILPSLVGGFFYALVPSSLANASALLRIMSGLFYLGTSALLVTSLLRSNYARAALMALLFVSAYPVLWLSSELLAGGLLCLAIWLVVTERQPWLVGLCLGALALTKPELIVVSLAVGIFYISKRPGAVRGLLVGFTPLVAVLVAPSLVVHGTGFFGNRSWVAFGQHFAAMVSNFKLIPDQDPWAHWQRYVSASFAGDHSVPQAVVHHKLAYSYFIAMSAVTGLWNAWRGFGFILVAIAIRIGLRGAGIRPVEQWLLVAMVALIPEILIAYPHVRYLAKFAPLVAMVPLAEIESRRDYWRIILTGLLAMYALLALFDRFHGPELGNWFPD